MSINGKLNGSWSTARINLKYNGVWHEENTTWVKLDGVWHAHVPSNVIILYAGSKPSNALLCDGTNSTPNLVNRYLYHKSSVTSYELLTGVSQNHTVNQHSAPAVSLAAYAHPNFEGDAGFSINYRTPQASHIHYSVLLNSSGDADVSPSGVQVIPTIMNDLIYANAIVFNSNSSVFSSCIAYLVKYIKLASTFATINTAAHRHAYLVRANDTSIVHNQYLNWGAYTSTCFYQPNNQYSYLHHHDNYTIYSDYSENNPYSTNALFGNKLVSPIYWDELEAGAITLFLGSLNSIPKGWSIYTGRDGYVRADGSVSNSSKHTHAGTSIATGGAIGYGTAANSTAVNNNPNQYYVPTNHVHTAYLSTVPESVDLSPPGVAIKLIRKD